jgi:hypothetical protein
MPRTTLAELTGIALYMVARANLDSDLTDEVLAQRMISEADPLFVEELGRALNPPKTGHVDPERTTPG